MSLFIFALLCVQIIITYKNKLLMNRIVLIGNGFDLANNYKTSYKDFIVWYFKEKLYDMFCNNKINASDALCTAKILSSTHDALTKEEIDDFSLQDLFEYFGSLNMKTGYEINYSRLLAKIKESVNIKGWVDIENDYYELLRFKVQNPNAYLFYDISDLNTELDTLGKKLIEYLKEVIKESRDICAEIQTKIFEPFKENDIAVEAKDVWMNFLRKRIDLSDYDLMRICACYKMDYYLLKHLFLNDYLNMVNDYLNGKCSYNNDYKNLSFPDNIMLLNFNYTDIADRYLLNDSDIFSVVHIHGKLDDPESVIFGYGDELDDKYKFIQETNINEYLKNIKSIKYLESDNYRRVLSFVESDYYQVYVMGHSCGKSDRTLLNTLFEHKNCVSIKPFYYVDKDTGKDNYLDIVQNISRNFTDMKLMRDRVVNKQFCEQLRKK